MKIKIISGFIILVLQGFAIIAQDEEQTENLLFKKSTPANASNSLVNSTSLKMQSSGYASDVTRYTYWNIFAKGVSNWGSGHLVFQSNTDGAGFKEHLRITNLGKLGIGTSSPQAKLEIAGHSDDLFTALKLRNTNGLGSVRSSVGLDFHHFNTPNDPNARIYEVEGPSMGTYGGNLVFATRTSGSSLSGTTLEDRLMIAHDGNIGIGTGTSDPQAKLHVNGKILALEVKVSTLAGEVPDYVFKEDYSLTSLEELEKYIKENHHLPEIPSAKEVEAEGLELAKMNLLLLKKIEEMTLYLITEKKRNDKVEEQNELLKNKIQTLEARLRKIENKFE